MNIAITGACGLLGAHLASAFSAFHRVVGFDRHPWWGTRAIELYKGDLADTKDRADFLAEARPDILVHCAAMVDVDAGEDRPQDAYLANATLTGLIARGVPSHCRVVYVTTDGIFRGDSPMQRETDLPCPRTVYGRSKLQGEWETQLATDRHLIIRTNFYGWSSGVKNTSAEWLYRALESGERITLFDDFWFTPIYVVDLAASILGLIAGNHSGIFHVVGSERVSKYHFGMLLAAAAGFPVDGVTRGSIANARLRAPRPCDMSLNSEKIAAVLERRAPDCDSGLASFLADRGRPLEARVSHLANLARRL